MAEAVITKAVSPAAIFLVNIFIPLYYDLYPDPMCILYYFFCLISSKNSATANAAAELLGLLGEITYCLLSCKRQSSS